MKLPARELVIAMMIAAHDSSWYNCLPKTKLARTLRGHLTAWLQPQGTREPETNHSVPQQEEQPDATEGKVIADYGLDINYEGSEPKIELDVQAEKEENSDAE